MSAASQDTTVREFRLFIGNVWVESSSGETFETLDPFSGKPWALVQRANAKDVDRAVQAAAQALDGPWSKLSATSRGMLMYKLAELGNSRKWRRETTASCVPRCAVRWLM